MENSKDSTIKLLELMNSAICKAIKNDFNKYFFKGDMQIINKEMNRSLDYTISQWENAS